MKGIRDNAAVHVIRRSGSRLQHEAVEKLRKAGYPCRWAGEGGRCEQIYFIGLDLQDGGLCEVWIEFANPYTLDGAVLQVNIPKPYRDTVRGMYQKAHNIITTLAEESR